MARLIDWHNFTYREFWDVPRVIVCRLPDDVLVLDCPFDNDADEYPKVYSVYLLPASSHEIVDDLWRDPAKLAIWRLPDLPVPDVEFDPTRRQSIRINRLPELMMVRTPVN